MSCPPIDPNDVLQFIVRANKARTDALTQRETDLPRGLLLPELTRALEAQRRAVKSLAAAERALGLNRPRACERDPDFWQKEREKRKQDLLSNPLLSEAERVDLMRLLDEGEDALIGSSSETGAHPSN